MAVEHVPLGPRDSTYHDASVFTSLSDVATATVDMLTHGNVALSGGSTYGSLFPLWASLNPDCSQASFYPVDERMVPIDDPSSNWGAALEAFLIPVGRQCDRNHFAETAYAYAELLVGNLGPQAVFDAVFLGAGDDGHTASLFPGTEDLVDTESVTLHTVSPKPPTDRITLAPGVLTRARQMVVIVSGDGKRPVVDAIRRGDTRMPVVSVLAKHPSPWLYVDASLV